MKYISFAIPCYNSEAYMEKAIHSILAGGEDAHDVVHVSLIDREAGQTGLPNGGENGLLIVIQGEGHHIGAVDHHILRCGVVELEDVLDQFLLGALDGAGLLALLHHGHDLVLRDLLPPAKKPQQRAVEQQDQVAGQADKKQDGPYMVR